jgi:hypothetical protein
MLPAWRFKILAWWNILVDKKPFWWRRGRNGDYVGGLGQDSQHLPGILKLGNAGEKIIKQIVRRKLVKEFLHCLIPPKNVVVITILTTETPKPPPASILLRRDHPPSPACSRSPDVESRFLNKTAGSKCRGKNVPAGTRRTIPARKGFLVNFLFHLCGVS